MQRLYKLPYELLDPRSIENAPLFKMIIIGDSAVGKSCLMNRVTTNEFVEDHEVTVGVEFGSIAIKVE